MSDETPATRALAELHADFTVVKTERARSAEESASFQGIPLDALLKTIVVRRAEDDHVFVLVPGDREIDWPKLRSVLGVSRLSLPDRARAEEVTGYKVGTITPFGATSALPVILDASASGKDKVALGGGAHGLNVHLSAKSLQELLGPQVADVTSPRSG
jgi:Cys-tRNA(Pro)/Cys-tRNA(Cys) deacylase